MRTICRACRAVRRYVLGVLGMAPPMDPAVRAAALRCGSDALGSSPVIYIFSRE